MRINRPLAAALALLASSALAGPQPIPKKELFPAMEAQLTRLKSEVSRELKDDPKALAKAMGYIEGTVSDFRTRVERLGTEPNYPIEAEYISGAFKVLILDKAKEAVGIMTSNKSAAFKAVALQKLDDGDSDRVRQFDGNFLKAHKPAIDEAVSARLEWKRQQPNITGVPPNDEGALWANFKNYAPLIQAGKASVAFGTNGTVTPLPPLPPPLPSGPAGPIVALPEKPLPAGGAAPNGPSNGGTTGGSNPGKPNGGPDWEDIMKKVTTEGAPRAIASSAGDALAAGRYSEAADLARTALQFDPKNKDAMGVLYSVKGRGEAIEASAGAMAPAKAGAAAFEPSGFSGAGPDSPARVAPEIAAAAATGATRLAVGQAMKSVKSALDLNDPEDALRTLSKALLQNPGNAELLGARGQVYGRLGRWEEALKDAAAGLEAAPGSMGLLRTKAIAENRTHRWRDALATSEEMIKRDPRNAWGYANRAHAWGGLGNGEAMLSDIKRAASLDPIFAASAEQAAKLQLPTKDDVMFLFPGETGKIATQAPAAAGRGRSFSVVMGAAIGGGLLLALGLLGLVLRPIKDAVVSSFTKAERHGPAVGPLPTESGRDTSSPSGSVGDVVRGQYEIKRKIGEGGMGMVYEGTDRSLGRRVAIKKMRDELRLNPRERDRFVIEAKTVASLHHANIVDIYAIAEEGEDVYLVFEYVEGQTVHDLVQSKGRVDVAEAVSVTRSMGEALSYAHSKGVIHRDMKPSNVMLSRTGEIKVMDFGIARMAKDALTRYSMTQNVVGTPPYMAPEQEQGVVRKESDVYSLAICAYEMLTGKLPFIGIGAGMLMNKINMSYIPPARAIAGLPEALDEVFLKAFQADPDRRYRTPQEFVVALEAAAGGAKKIA
jgi:tetratricopeptide (TPR) repeat protein/predicted Ser/Thr protein kinase